MQESACRGGAGGRDRGRQTEREGGGVGGEGGPQFRSRASGANLSSRRGLDV